MFGEVSPTLIFSLLDQLALQTPPEYNHLHSLPQLLNHQSTHSTMASATGMPEYPPTEQEPLLGRAGDAAQKEGRPLYENLIIGTIEIPKLCSQQC